MKNGTTSRNGHTPAALPATVAAMKLTPRNHLLAQAELDAWDDELATLNQALQDQAAAREMLADSQRRVELARERCRLLRAAVATQLAAGIEA